MPKAESVCDPKDGQRRREARASLASRMRHNSRMRGRMQAAPTNSPCAVSPCVAAAARRARARPAWRAPRAGARAPRCPRVAGSTARVGSPRHAPNSCTGAVGIHRNTSMETRRLQAPPTRAHGQRMALSICAATLCGVRACSSSARSAAISHLRSPSCSAPSSVRLTNSSAACAWAEVGSAAPGRIARRGTRRCVM